MNQVTKHALQKADVDLTREIIYIKQRLSIRALVLFFSVLKLSSKVEYKRVAILGAILNLSKHLGLEYVHPPDLEKYYKNLLKN